MLGIELTKRFSNHAPGSGMGPVFEEVRTQARALASTINLATPDSREKSLAITKLEEAVMWANAALARNGLEA